MNSETIAQILKYAPTVQCFAVGSDDLARQNSVLSVKHRPRTERKRAARNAYRRWQRLVQSIIDDARSAEYDHLISCLQALPLDAIRLTFGATSADSMIDQVSEEIQEKSWTLIGIYEQIVTDELAFVWLWNDT